MNTTVSSSSAASTQPHHPTSTRAAGAAEHGPRASSRLRNAHWQKGANSLRVASLRIVMVAMM